MSAKEEKEKNITMKTHYTAVMMTIVIITVIIIILCTTDENANGGCSLDAF